MSTLAVFPGLASVVVAVDTAFEADGEATAPSLFRPGMAKCFPMPHLPAVVAGRGSVNFVTGVHQRLAVMGRGMTFDGLVKLLAPQVVEARKAVVDWNEMTGTPAPASLGSVLLAGWSDARQTMEAWMAFDDGPGRPVEKFALVEPFVVPTADSMALPVPDNDGEDAVADLMNRIVSACRSDEWPALGGRMVYTRLTRTSIHSTVRDLREPAATGTPR